LFFSIQQVFPGEADRRPDLGWRNRIAPNSPMPKPAKTTGTDQQDNLSAVESLDNLLNL